MFKKRLLLPLLAALALPNAVNAETWYLLGKGNSGTDFTIPMQSKEDCLEQGQRFLKGKNWEGDSSFTRAWICIKGK